MKDSEKLRIQNQFSAFCIKVLKNAARNIQREYALSRKYRKSLSDLSEKELEQIAQTDMYFMSEHIFDVFGLPVVVTGDALSEALQRLEKRKRDIILMHYYLRMTDLEISRRLNVVRQTVTKNRHATLRELREYLDREEL